MMRRILLWCGVVSSLFYVAFQDIFTSLRYEGYSITGQFVSELNATGAPTRPLFVVLSFPYNLLLAAFGVGVYVAGRTRAARITGIMLVLFAVTSQITPLFFPMAMRGTPGEPFNSLHGPMTAVQSLFTLLAMGFGATLLGRRFRIYTWLTILTLVVFGVLTFPHVPNIAAGQHTPWAGLIERVNIYATMLWVAALAVGLLRVRDTPASRMLPATKLKSVA